MGSHALINREAQRQGVPPAAVFAENSQSDQAHPELRSEPRNCAGLLTEAAQILDDVRRALDRGPKHAREAALRLVTLLASPRASDEPIARGGLAPWQQGKLDRFLRDHLDRPLYLNELADLVHLSASHFCRAFKESFGSTPHAYIIGLRLELAQKLMLATDEPLSQIALACGLGDQAHLSKLFRCRLGQSPNAWRRQNLTEDQAEAAGRARPSMRYEFE
jgi:AraC family transcriptional regulator